MNRRRLFAALAGAVSALAFGAPRPVVSAPVDGSSESVAATGGERFLTIVCFDGPSNCEGSALSQNGPPADWLNATPTERLFMFNGGITPHQAPL
jgi:hypothetical protein